MGMTVKEKPIGKENSNDISDNSLKLADILGKV